MLIGWFLISAASAEQAAATVASALAGVRVADIMTADPDLTPGGSTVQDFIDAIAIHSRQDAFPVVDFNGRLTGLMVVDQLTRIRPVNRPSCGLTESHLPFRRRTGQRRKIRLPHCSPAAHWVTRSWRSCW